MLTTFAVLTLLVGLVGLIGLLGHYHPPGSTALLGLSAVTPYLVLGPLAAGVLFAVGRGVSGWVGLGLSVALVAWYVAVQAPLFGAAALPSGGRDVVVMTANLKLGMADPHALVAAARSHQVEVLMLEELTDPELQALQAAGLDELLPHSVADARPGGAGTGLWSRYPLTDIDTRQDFAFGFVTARIAVPGSLTPPVFAALHMFGPYPQTQVATWLQDMAHLPAVLAAIPSDAPVVVGGDFNATPDVVQFRRLLRGGYADAGQQAGAGFLPTYPTDRIFAPVIAIDHVLTRDAVAHRAETLTVPQSDHRALVVTVRLGGVSQFPHGVGRHPLED